MEETLLKLLEPLADWVPLVLSIIGGVAVIGKAVVKMTPSGKDDELVAKIEKIPLLGGFIAALISRAPIKGKE